MLEAVTLSELRPRARFRARRFHMNVVIETGEAGFVENAWVGGQLAIGSTVRLGVSMPDRDAS